MRKLTEQEQAHRNLHPHAEAILAMNLWNDEYAFKQRGGVMDFWDSIGERRQNRCHPSLAERKDRMSKKPIKDMELHERLNAPPEIRHDLTQCPFCGASPQIEFWHGGGPQKTKRSAIAKWQRRAP